MTHLPEDYEHCDPAWEPSPLSECLADEYANSTGLHVDRFGRDHFAFAVHRLINDPELSELFDRERYTGGAA